MYIKKFRASSLYLINISLFTLQIYQFQLKKYLTYCLMLALNLEEITKLYIAVIMKSTLPPYRIFINKSKHILTKKEESPLQQILNPLSL